MTQVVHKMVGDPGQYVYRSACGKLLMFNTVLCGVWRHVTCRRCLATKNIERPRRRKNPGFFDE